MTSISDLKDAIVNKCNGLISSHNSDSNAHSLSTVARSGSYNDLTDKPSGFTVDSSLSSSSTNPVQNKVITDSLDNKAETGHLHDSWTEVYNNKNLVIKYNSAIGLCHAVFSMSYNFTDNNPVTYITGIPAPYRPPTNMSYLAHPNGTIYISLNSGGVLQFKRASGTGSVNIGGVWVYIGQ